MKYFILITTLLVTLSSFAQNSSYDERKAALEIRNEAKRKFKDEYISESGIVYAVGDTITIYGKLGWYEGIRTKGDPMRWKRDPRDVRVIITKIDKYVNSVGDFNQVKAICKGIDKKGRFAIVLEKAYSNCETQKCDN